MKSPARYIALLVVVAVLGLGVLRFRDTAAPPAPPAPVSEPAAAAVRPRPRSTDSTLLVAIEKRRDEIWGVAAGIVVRLLEDDRKGIPHQRFIFRIETGTTILAEYNLDLAPRIPLEVGDTVVVRGEYHWNDAGGRIHWLHHDPSGAAYGGWVVHRGKKYE